MKKKKILILVGCVICIGIIGFVFLFARGRIASQKKGQDIKTDSGTPALSPTPKEELILWEDPAGFTFLYPKELDVDKHDEDQENYAHIEFIHTDHKGKTIIWAKDTTATTISQWLKNERMFKDAVNVDTTLGGNEAKKVLFKEPIPKQFTATLDEDVVIIVETYLEDHAYWQNVNDTIIGSFMFRTSTQGESSEGASAENELPSAEADEVENIE